MFHYSFRKPARENEDKKLPFISAEEVKLRNGKDKSELWVVIDDMVYDCSTFANRHPGGETVLRSFGGKDCSWQYHRIHGMHSNAANKWLSKLRIGITKAVDNPYGKPKTEHVECIRLSTQHN